LDFRDKIDCAKCDTRGTVVLFLIGFPGVASKLGHHCENQLV
jgi:hypothetical protein